LSLHLLHSVGEILNQLHLCRQKLLHVWIHFLVDRWGGAGFCWFAICARITGGTSLPPPDLVFTIWPLEKIIFQIVVLESMHKKITQNEIAACSSA
jgi:hypothetical protein